MAGAVARQDDSEDNKLQGHTSSTLAPEVAEIQANCSFNSFLAKLRDQDHSVQEIVVLTRDFVNDFPCNLSGLQAVARVHDFLGVVSPKLCASTAFVNETSREGKIIVEDNFERFVWARLSKTAAGEAINRRSLADELCDKKLLEKKEALSGKNSLGTMLSTDAQEQFDKAVEQLSLSRRYPNPRDKLVCFINAYRIVDAIVDDIYKEGENKAGDPDEDMILRKVLKAVVVEASPSNLCTSLEVTAAFKQPSRTTQEERRCLRDLSAAIAAATEVVPKIPLFTSGTGNLEDLPLWLEGTGVTFRFEEAHAEELRIGEADELLDAYHRMAGVLQTLANGPKARDI